jgi:hypothetical protein
MLVWPPTVLLLQQFYSGPVKPPPLVKPTATAATAPAAPENGLPPAGQQARGVFWDQPAPAKVRIKLVIPSDGQTAGAAPVPSATPAPAPR